MAECNVKIKNSRIICTYKVPDITTTKKINEKKCKRKKALPPAMDLFPRWAWHTTKGPYIVGLPIQVTQYLQKLSSNNRMELNLFQLIILLVAPPLVITRHNEIGLRVIVKINLPQQCICAVMLHSLDGSIIVCVHCFTNS